MIFQKIHFAAKHLKFHFESSGVFVIFALLWKKAETKQILYS